MLSVAANAQKVFIVVYADSYDDFVNIRSEPSMNGRILTELYGPDHGLGSGVLLERGQYWSKVQVGNVVGWAYNKYLGTQSWYKHNGKPKLIANKDKTPIYGEDFSGQGRYPVFAKVEKGTIIADEYEEWGHYYVLMTGHDTLMVKKTDVILR